jgi:phosphatidate cytidylyltransferase
MQDDVASEDKPAPSPRPGAGDLLPRLISGVVLGAVALGLAWAGPKPFALLVLLVSLLMSWEWGRVVRGADFDLTFYIHAAAVTIAVLLAMFGFSALGLAVLVAGTIIAIPLQFGERGLLSAAGVLYTGLPAVALLWLRGDEPYGRMAVIFILALVAVTDTAAYFVGRAAGGPRLWPRISPNKTWSGLLGGILASAGAGALFAHLAGASVPALAVSGLMLGLVAQAGDLAESALKRHFGMKDASNLIPGHGGFMDRMDGVVTVAVTAALFALYANAAAPAQALLFGS